jgi:RNA polymerase sigma-70 factor (ECF subfamily)
VGNGWPQRREGFGGRRADSARPRRGASGNLQGEFLVHRWVELAKEGDRDAMAALYGRYAGTVYAHVKRILGDAHEAEDVTQHVFAKLLTVLPRYERREAPFAAWILRMAHNAAVDHLRRSRSVPCEEVRPIDTRADQTGRECAASLREAFAALPADQRDVVVLRHVVGLTSEEIAGVLGRSVGSVRGLHHRGRAATRAALSDLGAAPAIRPPMPGAAVAS